MTVNAIDTNLTRDRDSIAFGAIKPILDTSLHTRQISFTDAAATDNSTDPFSGNCAQIRVYSDAKCHICVVTAAEEGADATTSMITIPAAIPEMLPYSNVLYVSVIGASGSSGTLEVTEIVSVGVDNS